MTEKLKERILTNKKTLVNLYRKRQNLDDQIRNLENKIKNQERVVERAQLNETPGEK